MGRAIAADRRGASLAGRRAGGRFGTSRRARRWPSPAGSSCSSSWKPQPSRREPGIKEPARVATGHRSARSSGGWDSVGSAVLPPSVPKSPGGADAERDNSITGQTKGHEAPAKGRRRNRDEVHEAHRVATVVCVDLRAVGRPRRDRDGRRSAHCIERGSGRTTLGSHHTSRRLLSRSTRTSTPGSVRTRSRTCCRTSSGS